MEQKDLSYIVSKELGISEDLVKKVVTSFWLGVRRYLTDPLNAKKGILIFGFGKFFINPYTIERIIRKRTARGKTVDFYKQLYKQLEDEGQTKEQDNL